MNRPSFATLKLSSLLLAMSLLLAGGGVLWSWFHTLNADESLQRKQAELRAAQQKLDNSRQQQQLVATYLADYQALMTRGFVGPENRLVWIEAVQKANQGAALYGLNYHLTPRAAAPPKLADGLPLGQTTMTLTLPVLVETDVSHFLAALMARVPGMVHVKRCRLANAGKMPFEAINQPRLHAECELQWFTIEAGPGSKS